MRQLFNEDKPAVVIMDNFKGQITEAMTELLERHRIYTCLILANATSYMTLNSTDRYSVAVLKDDIIISHLPRVLSQICSLFVARGETVTCVVNGARRYSVDLPQGGLEVPCILQFSSSHKEIAKLKLLLAMFTNGGAPYVLVYVATAKQDSHSDSCVAILY